MTQFWLRPRAIAIACATAVTIGVAGFAFDRLLRHHYPDKSTSASTPTIISAADLATAPKAALDFKGVRIGDSESAVRSALNIPPSMCFESKDTSFERTCMADVQYAVPLNKVIVGFAGGRLARVIAEYSSSDHDTLIAAMKTKYGEPAESLAGEVQSTMGVRMKSRTVVWSSGGITLLAEERSSRIDKGMVGMTGEDDPGRAAAQTKARAARL